MKQLTIGIAVIHILFFSVLTNAEEIYSSTCQSIQNANDVLNCTKENHVDIQINRAFVKESTLGIDVAKQRPNPEFGAEGLDNKDGSFTSELNLLHTFELGGKRRARKKLAVTELNSSETSLLKAKENAVIQAVLNLYRLRQITDELAVVRENLSTFRKVRTQYNQVGKLNPEQDFSVSIFQIAEDETRLRIGQLNDEYNQILSTLHLAVGNEFKMSQKILPKQYSKWPSIENHNLGGADMKELIDDVEIAKNKYGIEKSQSWPDLAVGPKVELNNGNNNQTKFGFGLSIPLPIYQANGAGRNKAKLGLQRSELQATLKRKELESYRTNLVKSYKNITRTLVNSRTRSGISMRHSDLHVLLDRGVVQAPLIIELHREILEFYERLHEQELRAVGSLWKIYALDGHILEEKLP